MNPLRLNRWGVEKMLPVRTVLACSVACLASHALAQQLTDPAAVFGAREQVQSIALSPDGETVVFVQPTAGQGAALVAADLGTNQSKIVTRVDGKSQRLGGCDFVSKQRLVCELWAIRDDAGTLVPISRMVAFNLDGSNAKVLGERDSFYQIYARGTSGRVIDYLPGVDNAVLMAQTFIPEARQATRLERRREGLGVVHVDTADLKTKIVESPGESNVSFVTDGRGNVRIKVTRAVRGSTGMDSPMLTFWYRPAAGGEWKELGKYDTNANSGIWPAAVDPQLNVAYAFEDLNGRDALYRVKLDGSLQKELVASHDQVDVDSLLRIGRSNRVVGVSYATEKREVIYFDPALRQLAAQLGKALPNLPMIHFADASEDEARLLIWAGGDTDPGRYYTYDKASKRLNEIMLVRPDLESVPLAPVKPIAYRAADGTQIPGYLTLPPGKQDAKGLPALVMPHGGPEARDEWGFDWLAQYFAHRGYAVLQPNFRGSAGYGDAWFRTNGFKSWRTAIGDVNDAGRWLVAQGIADPAKLGIFGWSYGGYAALQSSVLDSNLFKAVVAVAPVTDLDLAKKEWSGFSNAANVRDYFGTGPHIAQGSPARNASAIKAPVLMFHGDLDRNVGVQQARVMDERLKDAGGKSELVVYPGLDHQLDDGTARADMLRRSDAFLRQAMKID
jgi:dipeptidyl aminopeptidase/acylaminoacyl peptidase